MGQNGEEPGHEGQSSRFNLVAMETSVSLHQICSNVIGYCRIMVNSAGKSVLSDELSEARERKRERDYDFNRVNTSPIPRAYGPVLPL